MSGFRLSPRLKMLLELVPQSQCCCDIGTDHGYLAIALSERLAKVIAMDLRSAPLACAAENVRRFGSGNIELRQSDGFAALNEGEADCAVIAGMGGELTQRLLSGGTKGVKYFVLQPQSLIYDLRAYLNRSGFVIEDERLCRELDRFYVAMLVRRGEQAPFTEAELRLGPVLLKKRPPLFREYAEDEARKISLALEKIRSSAAVTANEYEYERLLALYGGIISETQ